METSAADAELLQIRVDHIDRNPDNPRIVFRQTELDHLLDSIQRYGVQVPVSVFRHGKRFVLIDGERRWRCCRKLNLATIPALVQDRPTPLTNLLLMFNIHSLREQWDLLTIATKLPRLIELVALGQGRRPTAKELSDHTGLPTAVIRRCNILLSIPDHHISELLGELQKPKSKQRLSEDLYIEVERALTTVERRMPDLVENKDQVRTVLIDKYKSKVIDNVIEFRQLAKIARADNVEADKKIARRVLTRLFQPNKYSANDAFSDSVAGAYAERDLLTRIRSLSDRLETLETKAVDTALRKELMHLLRHIKTVLGN